MSENIYIIDFDSTFTQVEALDELAAISLANHPDKEKILQDIVMYTNRAMEGTLSFRESLSARVALLEANEAHLKQLVTRLKKKVSRSFSRNAEFFKNNAGSVFIVSGGFKEFIEPVVQQYHIKKENIYANTFTMDATGKIIGYDEENPLSAEGGKVTLLQTMNLQGNIFGIGDGYSDFQLRESGLIQKFYAFTENISRESVVKGADHVTPSFEEFLYLNNLPRALSYPRNRILCVVVGDIDRQSIDLLKKDGFSVRHKQTFEEKYIADAGMLLLSEEESISTDVLARAVKLKTIGYLGNAKNKVSSDQCTKQGIVLFDDAKGKANNGVFIPQRMADFINSGATYMSRNFPNLQLPKVDKTHRLIHIHHNVPGIMARLNTIFALHEMNIVSQFLMTNAHIGYCITDVNTGYDKQVLSDLKKIPDTIKFRILY